MSQTTFYLQKLPKLSHFRSFSSDMAAIRCIRSVTQNILSDRKVKLIELAETVKISKEPFRHIVHEYLDMCKRSGLVLHEVTIDQKQQSVDDREQCLDLFKRYKNEILRRYLTMDETWLHYFTPEML